jgi:hypothetical protein
MNCKRGFPGFAVIVLLSALAPFGRAGDFRQEACASAAEAAVLRRLPAISAEAEAVRTVAKFDCGEAALLKDLDHPASTANARFEKVVELLEKLPVDFSRKSLDYVTPYCRTDSDYYGSFCMGSDIEAAKDVFNDPELLNTVPAAVRAVAQAAARGGSIDLVKTVAAVMPPWADRAKAVKLAGFLGLDDNGVQTDRLKADLLLARRYDDYALVFVPLSQMFSGHYSDYEDGTYFPMLLFTTRTGTATLPGLGAGTKKTYKAFSAMYLGCKLARDGFNRDFIKAQAGSLGFFYEAIKTRDLNDVGKFVSLGFQTAGVMRTASDYGQSLCR